MGWFAQVQENGNLKGVIAFIIGAGLGVFSSFTVNCTLVEITINSFFAFYFGILFLLIGGIIMWRVKAGDHPKPFLLAAFATLVLIAGLMCFILEEDWFIRLGFISKIPIYSLLGVAVCFALLFSLIDLINYCTTLCFPLSNHPHQAQSGIVTTDSQVYLVVGAACLMGLAFGFIFGLMDVEDARLVDIRFKLMREESICYPIGALLGGIAAVINVNLPTLHSSYNPVANDDDLDEDF